MNHSPVGRDRTRGMWISRKSATSSGGTGDDYARAAQARRWQRPWSIIVMGGRYRVGARVRQAVCKGSPRSRRPCLDPNLARGSEHRIPGNRDHAIAATRLLDMGKARERIVEALHQELV